MRKFIQQKLKDQKGLTLIELLAVIVILAIIAAIAIPAIGNIIENSRVGAIKSDATNIINAAEIYKSEGGIGGEAPDAAGLVSLSTLEDQGYIEDAGSFANSSKADVTVTIADGVFNGTSGTVGKISINFTKLNKNQISAMSNSEDQTYTVGSGTAVVSGR